MNLDLNFAWKICKHVKSNAIVIAKAGWELQQNSKEKS